MQKDFQDNYLQSSKSMKIKSKQLAKKMNGNKSYSYFERMKSTNIILTNTSQ